MRTDIDIAAFEKRLLEEKKTLEEELATLGVKNTDNPGDWVATPASDDEHDSDLNVVADAHESSMERFAVLDDLEQRHAEVIAALQKIQDGTYGICENGGGNIPVERLEANPAARTCLHHAPKEEAV